MRCHEASAGEEPSSGWPPVVGSWSRVLAEIAERCQGLHSEQAVATVLVEGGLGFGFERGRLWRVSDDGGWLEGLAQAGSSGQPEIIGVRIPRDQSTVGRYMPNERSARCFGPEHMPYLATLYDEESFARPRGAWVNVPLWGDGWLRGVLTLDNFTREMTLSAELVDLLSLYGWQASAALERARKTYERDWLQAVAAVAEEAQRAATEQAILDVAVQGGLRFGFARARLWRLSDRGDSLIGVYQAANTGLDDFTGFEMPLAKTRYLSGLTKCHEPILIPGRRAQPGYLDEWFAETGFEPPAGEWVCIPLWVIGQLWGALMLDSGEVQRPRHDQHQVGLLRLLGRQIEAALERLRKGDERDWLDVLTTVTAQVQGALSEREVASIVVEGGLRLGFTRARLWKLSEDGTELVGLSQAGNQGLGQFVGLRVPLKQTVYGTLLWEEHGIRVFEGGRRPILLDELFEPLGFAPPAGQWVEIPLWADGRRFGTLTLDNADQRDNLRPHQRNLLAVFGAQVAAALDRAHRYEHERHRGDELEILSWASAEVARVLSERPERSEWFWDVSLQGVIWARATFGFRRALLFLSDGAEHLRGEAAASQPPRRRSPHRRHLQRVARRYLSRLTSDRLRSSALQRLTRQWELTLGGATDAFRITLSSGRRCVVQAEQAAERLPGAFIERYGVTDYALLPLSVGARTLGVVVVDGVFDGDSLRRPALDHLEAFLARAALTYEIMHQRRAREDLITLNHTVLANMRGYALHEILSQIGRAAQEATGADSVTIYPFLPSSDPLAYDEEAIVCVGRPPLRLARPKPRQRGVTSHIVHTGTLVVPDVQTDQERYDGRLLADYGLLQQERIRAFIGAPIRDHERGETLGVLYVDFRRAQTFSPFDRHLVESLASLAYLGLRNARFDQRVQADLHARERELIILKRVLEEALVIDLDGGETRIARTLLDATRDLLRPTKTDAWVGLLLRKWDRPLLSSEVARRERHRYYWQADGQLAWEAELDTELGITGEVLRTACSYRTGDVCQGEAAALFQQGGAQNTRSELDVPICHEPERRALGVLNIESPHLDAFTPAHQVMVERLAAVAALALGNLQRLRYLHDMLTAIQAVTTSENLPQILETVRDAARAIAPDVSAWSIWYCAPESRRITFGPSFGAQFAAASDDIAAVIMQGTEPVWAQSPEEALSLGEVLRDGATTIAAAAFPLHASGAVVGAMLFSYQTPHEFSGEERLFFPMIAAIAAAGIQQALRLEATQKERDRLHAAMAVTEAVGTSLDRGQVLPKILETLQQLFPDASVLVVTYDQLEETLVFAPESRNFYHIDNRTYADRTGFSIHGTSIAARLASQSLQTGDVAMANIGDVSQEPAYLGLISTTQSELCLTLVSAGRLLGALVIESATPNAFDHDDEDLVRSVGYQIGLALDRAYQSAQLRFKTALAARTAWAAEVAHDINTEIGKIRTLVYLLQHSRELPADALGDLVEIARSAERLAGSFHESQPGQTRATGPVHIDQLVRSAVADIYLGGGIIVKLQLTCGDAAIYAAEVTMRRLLHHLIRNAREAMGGHGELTISTSCDGNRVFVEVVDTGPGIPDEQRQQIFNQPITTKDREGGLGLLFVRSSIEDLGGTIRLLAWEPNRGAAFVIALPQLHSLGTREDYRWNS